MHCHRVSRAVVVLYCAGLVLGLTACSSLKVSHEYDREQSFAGFETFDLLPSKSIADDDLRELIEILIANELEDKGLERVKTRPDLLVTCDGGRTSREQIAIGLGYTVETSGGVTEVYTVSRGVPGGVLVIALIDRSTGTIVWKAMGEAVLKPGDDIRKRLNRLEPAIVKMLAPFPPR